MDGSVGALNASNGAALWFTRSDDIPDASEFFGPLIFDARRDLLYGANMHGRIVAINPYDGRLVASSTKLAKTVANNLGPAISEGGERLFVGTYDGKLMSLLLPP